MIEGKRNKTNQHSDSGSGGDVKNGLSERKSLDEAYTPRDSGEGERPMSPTKEKVGKFTIC